MKKLFTLFILLASIRSFAGVSLYQLSNTVNKEWLQHQNEFEQIDQKNIELKSSKQLIQFHLLQVVNILSKNNIESLSISAQQNRKMLLAKLKTYAEAGLFPINTFLSYTNPVFIDDYNTHCAVGFLMQQSGCEGLAQEINASQRFAFIKEIKNAKVQDWAAEFGFTIDELAWIQPSYPAFKTMGKIAEGVNGTVLAMIAIDTNHFVIGGDFTAELKNNTTCNHIAMVSFENNVWQITPMQNGVNGPVYALFRDNTNIIIGGHFTSANGVAVNNIAQFDLLSGSQPYSAIGSLDSTVLCIIKYDNKIFAGGQFLNYIKYWQNNTWNNLQYNLIASGEVRTLEVFNGELYIGGKFDIATGAPRKNIAKYSTLNGMGISNFGCPTPVNDFCIFKNDLLAACDFYEYTDTCALAKLGNNDWEILIKPTLFSSFSGNAIKTFIKQDTNLYFGGDFISNTLMYSGTNIAKVFAANGVFITQPITTLDKPVNIGLSANNKILFAGDFINNQSVQSSQSQAVNRIAYLDFIPLSIRNFKNDFDFNVYPNPTHSSISIQSNEDVSNADYIIYNQQGQLVMTGKVNGKSINISNLNIGLYQLVLQNQHRKSSIAISKN
jgi:Secretion system C-terminal sorting domain